MHNRDETICLSWNIVSLNQHHTERAIRLYSDCCYCLISLVHRHTSHIMEEWPDYFVRCHLFSFASRLQRICLFLFINWVLLKLIEFRGIGRVHTQKTHNNQLNFEPKFSHRYTTNTKQSTVCASEYVGALVFCFPSLVGFFPSFRGSGKVFLLFIQLSSSTKPCPPPCVCVWKFLIEVNSRWCGDFYESKWVALLRSSSSCDACWYHSISLVYGASAVVCVPECLRLWLCMVHAIQRCGRTICTEVIRRCAHTRTLSHQCGCVAMRRCVCVPWHFVSRNDVSSVQECRFLCICSVFWHHSHTHIARTHSSHTPTLSLSRALYSTRSHIHSDDAKKTTTVIWLLRCFAQ